MEPRRIGFVVNPIAGMGGRVALKGTDGVVDEARARGAEPVAPGKARETMDALIQLAENKPLAIEWVTSAGSMGADALSALPDARIEVVHDHADATTAVDTEGAVRAFLEHGVEFVVFCGGDGTARDVVSVTGTKVPVMGIPSGVKMYSGVFGIHPASCAQVIWDYLHGQVGGADAEVLDLDEDAFRDDRVEVRLHAAARTLAEPTYIQSGKMGFERVDEDELKDEMAMTVVFEMRRNPDTLYILGSGSTVEAVGRRLGLGLTVLGIDVVLDRKIIAKDADEKTLLNILEEHADRPRCLVLTPIGAQGFILGRGNQQLSPQVVRAIGMDCIMILAMASKLAKTPVLRVDTGDRGLDREFTKKGYLRVTVGFNTVRMVKVEG